MKGALTLVAQDAASRLILYTAADIQRDEANDQILAVSFLLERNATGTSIHPGL